MFTLADIVWHQGKQFIPDVTKVTLPGLHHGRPEISNAACRSGCSTCAESCPAKAISSAPIKINLGQCVFCGECETICPEKKIKFTNDYKICSNTYNNLLVQEGNEQPIAFDAEKIRKEVKRCFGKSLKLRLVSAGSCNGCELELNACGNVNFDMGRFGIEFLASPRHCDGVVVTGPIVENSVKALEITWDAIPQPKILILAGACAISGGIFADGPAVNRNFLQSHIPDLLIPGCPIHPLTFINGVLKLIRQ